ncbi:MAG: helix-turn-helix domain-containing protein [Clostridia bacterium]|nr:helix-turn-helix domain-containing protein [Clostridia bacterium]
MKYELHDLDKKRLPFIIRQDVIRREMKDFTHWHENIELLYFTEGEGRVVCNFSSYRVKKGDIFVVNSENLHMVESDSIIKYYCIVIDSDFCNFNGIPAEELKFFHIINNSLLIEKYVAIIKHYETYSDFREARIKLAMLDMLVHLLNFIEPAETNNKTEQEDSSEPQNLSNIKLAIKFIKENFAKRITVEDISEASGLSRAYFSRKFKSITGFTLVNYVNLVRCQHASQMLKTGKYKINEVAIECGFENMSYFTKTYKRLMGALPSDETSL